MVTILRLGERPERDHRINTHLALVARAFGAKKLIMFFNDPSLLASVSSVCSRFGSDFTVDVQKEGGWKRVLREWDGVIVHLTMYGQTLDDGIRELHRLAKDREGMEKDVLVIVGGEKVPAGIYQQADLNIGVGNQPHSEVAALAVFLDRYFQGLEFEMEMTNWKCRVVPSEDGKEMESRD